MPKILENSNVSYDINTPKEVKRMKNKLSLQNMFQVNWFDQICQIKGIPIKSVGNKYQSVAIKLTDDILNGN